REGGEDPKGREESRKEEDVREESRKEEDVREESRKEEDVREGRQEGPRPRGAGRHDRGRAGAAPPPQGGDHAENDARGRPDDGEERHPDAPLPRGARGARRPRPVGDRRERGPRVTSDPRGPSKKIVSVGE